MTYSNASSEMIILTSALVYTNQNILTVDYEDLNPFFIDPIV